MIEPPIYTVKRSKRKTIGIQVQKDGSVVVRAPYGIAQDYLAAVIEKRKGWIRQKQQALAALQAQQPIFSFEQGQPLFYLGQPFALQLQAGDKTHLSWQPETEKFLLYGPENSSIEQRRQTVATWFRQQAAEMLPQLAAAWAGKAGVGYRQVKVNGAKKRWGSCSAAGNLNFSWRLLFLPQHLIDYVVVHELCHRLELNHSAAFWQQVGWLLPDYATRRQQLRQWEKRLLFYASIL